MMYFTAILIGKTVLTAVVVIYASGLIELMRVNIALIPVLIAITALLTYIILKVDWARVVETTYDRGIVKGIEAFLSELSKVLAKLIYCTSQK